jgi:hypothetical protein
MVWLPRLRGVRASGRSRTDNPRITNAVLCQLKLRWRGWNCLFCREMGQVVKAGREAIADALWTA